VTQMSMRERFRAIHPHRPRPAPPSPRHYLPKRRVPALIAGPLIVALVVGGLAFGIKAAYGGFGHYYSLSVDLPRAGQMVEVGTDVRMRGVVVGHVDRMQLVDRRVRFTLKMDRQYRVPASAVAAVTLKTLLGAKYVDLRFPAYRGPFLPDGGRIRAAQVGPELEDAIADGVNVLDAIRPGDAATVVSTLAQAARGHGQDVARGLQANSDLAQLFASTLDPQLQALHDFDVVFGALKDSGVDLNALADAINQGVPVYASPEAEADLQRALDAVTPFANNLADLLILNRSDWDRLMDSGDLVLGAIASHQGGLHDLVKGLYVYVYKLSGAPYSAPFLQGSGAAGFVNFIGGDSSAENQRELCDALPLEIRVTVPVCQGAP